MQEDTPFTRRTIRVIIGTSLVLVFLHVALHLVFRFSSLSMIFSTVRGVGHSIEQGA